ncbi:MAG: hypothetical protein U0T36_03685 [Saprospiraceae bacterium]
MGRSISSYYEDNYWATAHKASTTVDLVLTLQPSAASNAWLNVAEISSFNDTAGNAIGMFDIDSDPDQSPNNDAGGLVNSPADNYLNGNGTGAPGSGVLQQTKMIKTQLWYKYLT